MKIKYILSLMILVSIFSNYSQAREDRKIFESVYLSDLEGQHSSNSRCRHKDVEVGEVVDCGGGKCYGVQKVCARQAKEFGPNIRALTDVAITSYGNHVVGGIGCPNGFDSIGTAADCGHGKCYGNMNFCMRQKRINPNKPENIRLISDLYLTPPGLHQINAACKAGYESVAALADCGGGRCRGSQFLCVNFDRFHIEE